ALTAHGGLLPLPLRVPLRRRGRFIAAFGARPAFAAARPLLARSLFAVRSAASTALAGAARTRFGLLVRRDIRFSLGRRGGRDAVDRLDPGAGQLLDRLDRFGVGAGGESDGDAGLARAAGAADTVDVIVRMPRHVVVEDVADVLD